MLSCRTLAVAAGTAGRAWGLATLVGVWLLLSAAPARAAFHLWSIQEIYTNTSGTLQFIEMKDPSGGQNFISFQGITAHDSGNTQSHTFTIPAGSDLPGSTQGHSLLFGTAGVQAAGGPTPNFILPDNFLFQSTGSISFFGANGGAYSSLPNDGIHSLIWGTTSSAINSPTNFAGVTGSVPEPAALSAFTLSSIGAYAVLVARRRRAVPCRA